MIKNFLIGLIPLLFLISCDNDSDTISNGKIAGEWHVTAIHNSSPSGPTLGPNEGETIAINFAANGSLNGTTSSNTFGGEFTVSGSTLQLTGLFSTEVAETPFGIAFFESLTYGMVPGSDFSEFELTFQNEERLDLVYQNFMFVSLQKQ